MADSVARGTLINLVTRLAGVALVLAHHRHHGAHRHRDAGGVRALHQHRGVLLALLSGFGIALARRCRTMARQPRRWCRPRCWPAWRWAHWRGWGCAALSAGPAGLPLAAGCWHWALRRRCCWRPTCRGCGWAKGAWLPMARLTLAPPAASALLLLGLVALLATRCRSPAVLASLGGRQGGGGCAGGGCLLWRGARLAAPTSAPCAPSCPSSPPSG
jgi:hypothetical protein